MDIDFPRTSEGLDAMLGMALVAKAKAAAGEQGMVLDWVKAANIIKEKGWQDADAGLIGDWGCTCVHILVEGKPVVYSDCGYLFSMWATPAVSWGDEFIECWSYENETPGWHEGTRWPEEALKILGVETAEEIDW